MYVCSTNKWRVRPGDRPTRGRAEATRGNHGGGARDDHHRDAGLVDVEHGEREIAPAGAVLAAEQRQLDRVGRDEADDERDRAEHRAAVARRVAPTHAAHTEGDATHDQREVGEGDRPERELGVEDRRLPV